MMMSLRRVLVRNFYLTTGTYFACMVAVVHAWQRRLTGKSEAVLMVTVDMRDGATSELAGSFISDAVLRTALPQPEVCVCVCVCEREREREREYCVCVGCTCTFA